MRFLVCRWEQGSIEALLDTGARIFLLVDEWEAANRPIAPAIVARVERYVVVSSFDAMDELSALATGFQEEGLLFDRVLSTCERGQLGAGYLATLLGVPGPSIVQSVRVRDKRAMKMAVAAAGVAAARFTTVPPVEPEAAAAHVAAEIGFPAVVKPVAGMGTTATARVGSAAALAAWLGENAEGAGPLMAEEMIPGEEFHVDAVWADGSAREVAICRYLVPRIDVDDPGHLNGAMLLPRSAEPELYAAVEAMHDTVNKALQFTDGITHLEVFRAPDGALWFSEIATRPGGGGAMHVHRPRGADLRSVWAASLVGGGESAVKLGEAPFEYVGWLLLTAKESGRVTRVPTDEEIAAIPYVLAFELTAHVGDVVRLHSVPPGLLVVYGADSAEEFTARALELEAALSFDSEPAAEPTPEPVAA